MFQRTILLTAVASLSLICTQSVGSEKTSFSPTELAFFEKNIRPILVKHCYECHSERTQHKGDLLLDSRNSMLKGGISGSAIVPGKPNQSLLIVAVSYKDRNLAMPPAKHGGKLADSIIDDLVKWVEMGAPAPGQISISKTDPYKAAKSWWAFQSITAPVISDPVLKNWAKTDIDRLVLASLEKQQLQPVALADKSTLLRRIYLDLTGLPPPVDVQDKFFSSSDPKAFEQIVDHLLQQPQFGERWGRHWLDVARYAETTGRDLNLTMPEAWRYRDYVIQSFNQDKPFDQFVKEQLAGDLITASGNSDRVQKIIATGFLAVGQKGLNEIDPRQFAVDLADEQIDAMSQAFLGITISCARCHDHKFDPISQRDYTALAGIFLSTRTYYGTPGGVSARNASSLIAVPADVQLAKVNRQIDPKVYAQKKRDLDAITKRLEEALRARAPKKGGPKESPKSANQISGFDMVRMMTRKKQFEVDLAAFNSDGTSKPLVMGVGDLPTTQPRKDPKNPGVGRLMAGPNVIRSTSGFEIISDSPLFIRGSIENEAEKVKRGLPEFLSHGKKLNIPSNTSGRIQLADWIVSPENTLTARVIANRIWYWLFGRGIVESVDNFGLTGTLPSNQQLLDYLATQLVKNGWSIKKLIREIVLSHVYQLDSCHDPMNHLRDPDNKYFWRSNTRRLDAETIRDSILFSSGNLDSSSVIGSLIANAGDGPVGGPRFQAIREEQIANATGTCRSVYLPIARNVQPESLAVFDFADPSGVIGARAITIVPPQALYLMNSDFLDQQSKLMAARVMKVDGFDNRIKLAFQLSYCRNPYPDEIETAKRFVSKDEANSWKSICKSLISSADFLFQN